MTVWLPAAAAQLECLAASSCHQTRYAIAARSAAAPLCHRPSLSLLCLSEQGEPAAETQQTLHARWIPPRLTGAQGISSFSLQHWREGRKEGATNLPCLLLLACTLTHDSARLDIANLTLLFSTIPSTIATLSRDHPIATPGPNLAVNNIHTRPDLFTPPSRSCILKPISITLA